MPVRARVLLIKNSLMIVGLIHLTMKMHEEIEWKGADGNSFALTFIALPEEMKFSLK